MYDMYNSVYVAKCNVLVMEAVAVVVVAIVVAVVVVVVVVVMVVLSVPTLNRIKRTNTMFNYTLYSKRRYT